MSRARLVLAVSLFLLSHYSVVQQTTSSPPTASPQRDPQAVALVNQALSAAGGTAAIGSVQDFTASGSITYYWAGAPVNAPVTLRGRGAQELRFDADLTEGTKTWIASYGQGSLYEPSGEKTSIPFSNSWNLGNLATPQLALLAALNDSSTSIVELAQSVIGNKQVCDIRLQKRFAAVDDPTGQLSGWTTKDYFIDPATLMVVAAQDTQASNDSPRHTFRHQLAFSDYRSVNGTLFPFSITETIDAQQTWTIQLSSITVNSGLTDSTFQL